MYKYELRIDGDGNKYLFCDSILTNEQINSITVGKIREKYSPNDEFKMNRFARTTTEWKEYNEHAESCVAIGKGLKSKAAVDTKTWKDYQRKNHEDEKDYIKRLKRAGLI